MFQAVHLSTQARYLYVNPEGIGEKLAWRILSASRDDGQSGWERLILLPG